MGMHLMHDIMEEMMCGRIRRRNWPPPDGARNQFQRSAHSHSRKASSQPPPRSNKGKQVNFQKRDLSRSRWPLCQRGEVEESVWRGRRSRPRHNFGLQIIDDGLTLTVRGGGGEFKKRLRETARRKSKMRYLHLADCFGRRRVHR